MKIKVLLAIFFVFMQAQARIDGPIIVGTGAGDSEYALTLTGQTLPEILSLCDADGCGLGTMDLGIVAELKRRSLSRPTTLFKATGSKDGRAFELDNALGVVYFFQDLLWKDAGRTVALDDEAAASLWIQILAEMNPRIERLRVRYVSQFITERVHAKLIRTKIDLNERNSVTAIVLKNSDGKDKLFIRDPQNNTHDLSVLVSPPCSELSSLQISSTRWDEPRRDEAGSFLQLTISRRYSCGGFAARSGLSVVLPFSEKADGTDQIDFNHARVFEQGI